MKTSLKAILAIAAMGASAIFAQAQTATAVTPKVVTIDLGRAFVSYYRTAEEDTKIKTVEQTANNQAQTIFNEGKAMADKFKEAQEAFNSPIATADAKQKAQQDAQRIAQDIQKKQDDLNAYRQNAVSQIQQQMQQTRQALLAEISTAATNVGKAKNATLVVERNACIYADPVCDITDEVIAQINKGHATPAPAAGAPAVNYPGR